MQSFIDLTFSHFENLYHQDLSHGIQHHKDVVNTLITMLNLDDSNFEEHKLALFCAAIHDLVDHKYEFNLEDVRDRISSYGFDATIVLEIITNMSWSKRFQNKVRPELEEIRNVCMYADWINAFILERCIQYSKLRYGENWKQNTIPIYHNKLFVMIYDIPDKYLYIAKPLHDQMVCDFKKLIFQA